MTDKPLGATGSPAGDLSNFNTIRSGHHVRLTSDLLNPYKIAGFTLIYPDVIIDGDGQSTIQSDPNSGSNFMVKIAANNLTFRNITFVGGLPMTTNSGTGAFIKVLLTGTPGSLASDPVLVNNQGGSGYVPDAGKTYFEYTITDNHDPMMAAAVIQCEVVSGRITSVRLKSGSPGAGYTPDRSDGNVHTLIVGRQRQTYTVWTDGMATWSNLTFENCFFKFGRSALRLNNTRDVRILDCRFEDQGPDASPIDLIDTSRAFVRGNRVYRPMGVANDAECIRVTTSAAAALIEDIIIAQNICEGATQGGGIVTNVANIRRLHIIANICKNNAEKQIDIKTGVNPDAATPREIRGASDVLVLGNICTTNINGNPIINLDNNNPARFDVEIRDNLCAFDLIDNNLPNAAQNAGIRLTAVNGATLCGNIVRAAYYGVRLVNNCQNVRLFGNDIDARIGIEASTDSDSAALYRVWSSGNRIRAIETGIDIRVGNELRFIGDDIEIFGDFIAGVSVSGSGTGYTGTKELFAVGSGEAGLIVATVAAGGALAGAEIMGSGFGEGGFGYLGGGTYTNVSGLVINVDNGGGMGGVIRTDVTNGVLTPSLPPPPPPPYLSPSIVTAGSGYLDNVPGAKFAVNIPERTRVLATVDLGGFTNTFPNQPQVNNIGRGFLAKPTLDTRAFGPGNGASFAVTMGSETPAGIAGMRLGNVSAVEVRNCNIRSWQKGIELLYDPVNGVYVHDVDIMDNCIRTHMGEPIVYSGGFNVRIRGNSKRRDDGAALAPQTLSSAAPKVQAIDHDVTLITTNSPGVPQTVTTLVGGTEGHVVTLRRAATVPANMPPLSVETGGNIKLASGNSFRLTHPHYTLTMICDGTNWATISSEPPQIVGGLLAETQAALKSAFTPFWTAIGAS